MMFFTLMLKLSGVARSFLLGAVCISALPAHSQKKTNIVFIYADDLGYMDTQYNGSDFYETPNLDRLAKENLVFPNAYAGGSNCAPSRACLISGQYNPRTEVYAVNSTSRGPMDKMLLKPVQNKPHLDAGNYTMPMALRAAGYATAIFGKWHIGGRADKTDPANRGFDVVVERNGARDKSVVADPKAVFELTDSAISFMKRNRNQPFFAYIAHHAIHSRHQTRPATYEKFRKKAPGRYHNDVLVAGSIYDLDESIGKLLKSLKDLGLEENTLLIVSSDNGGTHNSIQEPLRGNKGSFYEGGIRVPFIVRWPGKTKPGVNESPVINVDLYPTFVQLANGTLPPGKILDGESLLPLFSGEAATTKRDKIFWHFPGYLDSPVTRGRDTVFRTRPVTAMRKGNFKLLLYHEEWLLKGGYDKRETNNAIEIYDLKSDPGEHVNIANKNPQKRDELVNDLLGWMKDTGAKWPSLKKN